ncbi:MAG: putative polymerase ECF-type sigma factor [Acidobacteria bacterium]|jgi:RNA polymerase sigma-70 factor (ECF subfamily)|nr:putative polymerase ECF-type sigma factor [Acidobacteriota bacterium]
MGTKDSERILLERIRAGDITACDDCIRQHAQGIYRFAKRLMRNDPEAEDVVQETFMNAFKGIARFDGRSELRTWLYRIAYNAAMMRLRRRKPEFVPLPETGLAEDSALMPRQLFDWSGLPEKELEKAELREEMENAIQELPDKLQVVFIMRELEELSTEETAKALDLTIETVKTRLHRARLWLRERLSGYFASAEPASPK